MRLEKNEHQAQNEVTIVNISHFHAPRNRGGIREEAPLGCVKAVGDAQPNMTYSEAAEGESRLISFPMTNKPLWHIYFPLDHSQKPYQALVIPY